MVVAVHNPAVASRIQVAPAACLLVVQSLVAYLPAVVRIQAAYLQVAFEADNLGSVPRIPQVVRILLVGNLVVHRSPLGSVVAFAVILEEVVVKLLVDLTVVVHPDTLH